jgi:hypothetical protein
MLPYALFTKIRPLGRIRFLQRDYEAVLRK